VGRVLRRQDLPVPRLMPTQRRRVGSGRDATLHVVDGMQHVFPIRKGAPPEADAGDRADRPVDRGRDRLTAAHPAGRACPTAEIEGGLRATV
jgi:hypothetical protein